MKASATCATEANFGEEIHTQRALSATSLAHACTGGTAVRFDACSDRIEDGQKFIFVTIGQKIIFASSSRSSRIAGYPRRPRLARLAENSVDLHKICECPQAAQQNLCEIPLIHHGRRARISSSRSGTSLKFVHRANESVMRVKGLLYTHNSPQRNSNRQISIQSNS